MKKILVAIDFSDASRKAEEYAASLAKLFNAEIHLLHAYYIPTPIGDAPGYLPLSMTDVQIENEAELQQEIEYLTGQYHINVAGYIKMGLASGVIKDLAAEIGADLLVMGMKGVGKTGGIFGSTVISCIRKTQLPLLVIPEKMDFSPILHITFAADFANNVKIKGLGILEVLREQFNADIQIIHVQKDIDKMNIGEVAGKISTDILFSEVKHSFHTIENADIEKGINEFISENPTDMLVMVSHQHNLFERLFNSSHTRLIAYQTQVPLLVLHD